MKKSENTPTWDLKDMYSSPNDPKITKNKKEIQVLATKFTKNYKDKIKNPKISDRLLHKAIKDYETLLEKLYFYQSYASYLFSTDTQSPKTTKFYQESKEFAQDINTKTLWFELEVKESNKDIKEYRHYLKALRVFKPFTLSEKEEQIMSQKGQTSSSAFIRLYDEIDSNIKYELKVKNKTLSLSHTQLMPYIKNHPDRDLREKAMTSYSEGLAKNSKLYTFILNTLLLDKKTEDEIRNFKYPQQKTFLEYEVDEGVVKVMHESVMKRQDICEKYYLAKRKLLGIKNLHEWDRYSDIYNLKAKKYTWEESKKIILKTFKEFSPQFEKTAKLFFEKNWIDAKVVDGKRSGAFCSYNVPNHHPYILTNFTGEIQDITTLAHELGHGLHAYFSKDQNLVDFWPSTAVAEIASIFAESLVFEKLYSEEKDKKAKINLLSSKIQNRFAAIYRQNDFYAFEAKIHEKRRKDGELSQDEFGTLYNETLQKSFGKGLTLTDKHKNLWMPITHFYHYNFYIFTYVFGELLATSIYALYKEQGSKFVSKYIEVLSLGGSKSPKDLMQLLGIDLDDKSFWNKGLQIIEKEVEEFTTMV